MNIKNLITDIYKTIPMGLFEMEYDYEIDPHTIDLRLYGANKTGAETIKDIILEYDFNGITGATVETPSQDEINYAFSGYNFIRILMDVNRNIARATNEHHLFNDSGKLI